MGGRNDRLKDNIGKGTEWEHLDLHGDAGKRNSTLKGP